jgi:hypothetical protein
MMFAMSAKSSVEGFDVAVFWESDEPIAPAIAKLRSGLELLRTFHPRAFRDMQALLPRVLVTALASVAQCIDSQGLCLIDRDALESDYMTAERLAAVLAHETMHARLARAGFAYSRANRIRIERLCVKAELLLASRMPNGTAIVPELHEQVLNAERLWSTANHHASTLSRLRDLRFPKWFIQLVDRASRRRHRLTNAELDERS